MARNPEYEFSYETKIKALERSSYTCDRCGKHEGKGNDRLEAHHIIPLWFIKEFPVFAPALITSLCNLQILCVACHREVHKTESRLKYVDLAPQVLTKYLQQNLDTSKDDWRKQVRQYKGNYAR